MSRATTSASAVGSANAKAPRQPKKKEPGELPVELAELQIKGLFNRFDHTVSFPHLPEGATGPSLVLLHGQNGVGKTTLLLMLDGLMRLDFDVFRVRPFSSCSL